MKSFLKAAELREKIPKYTSEWQDIMIQGVQYYILPRMQKLLVGFRRHEIGHSAMSVITNTNGDYIFISQVRPNDESLCFHSIEMPGGYGNIGESGGQVSSREASEELGQVVRGEADLAFVTGDPLRELYSLTIRQHEITDEKFTGQIDSKEQITGKFSVNEFILQEMYTQGRLRDARTIGIYLAKKLSTQTSQVWQPYLDIDDKSLKINQIQASHYCEIHNVVKMNQSGNIAYDDLVFVEPNRNIVLHVKQDNNSIMFGLQERVRPTTTPNRPHSTINKNSTILEIQSEILEIDVFNLHSQEVTEGTYAQFSSKKLKQTILPNPPNAQFGISVYISENTTDSSIRWYNKNQLAQLVMSGRTSLLTLAAIQAYLWESGSNF